MVLIITMIYYLIKINKQIKRIRILGLMLDNPIFGVGMISAIQIVLWSINGAVKGIDLLIHNNYGNIKNNSYFSLFWFFLNIIYDFEGIIVSIVFINIYLSTMKYKINNLFYEILCKLFVFSRYNKIAYDESDVSTHN